MEKLGKNDGKPRTGNILTKNAKWARFAGALDPNRGLSRHFLSKPRL